jgi:hypothetical protein
MQPYSNMLNRADLRHFHGVARMVQIANANFLSLRAFRVCGVYADADLTRYQNSSDQIRTGAKPMQAGFHDSECGQPILGMLVKSSAARTVGLIYIPLRDFIASDFRVVPFEAG